MAAVAAVAAVAAAPVSGRGAVALTSARSPC